MRVAWSASMSLEDDLYIVHPYRNLGVTNQLVLGNVFLANNVFH